MPLSACSFRSFESDDADEDSDGTIGGDPGDEWFGLCVTTVRKEVHLRCSTGEERDSWLVALEGGRTRAIKEGLGHATPNPDHAASNEAGDHLFEKSLERDNDDGAHGLGMPPHLLLC